MVEEGAVFSALHKILLLFCLAEFASARCHTMDRESLLKYLANHSVKSISGVHTFSEIDSTNSEAERLISNGIADVQLVIADAQSAGRGRRGRDWVSPSGSGLYLSLVYPFSVGTFGLQGLSLVTALSAHAAIRNLGVESLQLKWPNDLLVGNKKLSGILLELCDHSAQTWVVFGIGVNYKLTKDQRASIGRPAIDVSEVLTKPPSIEQLAAAITVELLRNIGEFISSGFSTFQSAWNSYDRYLEKDIVIQNGNSRKIGRHQGVDENGSLLLQTIDGLQRISGGELFPSVREAGG